MFKLVWLRNCFDLVQGAYQLNSDLVGLLTATVIWNNIAQGTALVGMSPGSCEFYFLT